MFGVGGQGASMRGERGRELGIWNLELIVVQFN